MDREASHPALLFYGRQAIQRVRCPLGPESIGDVQPANSTADSPLISTSPPPLFLMPRESWSGSRRYSSTRVLLAPAAPRLHQRRQTRHGIPAEVCPARTTVFRPSIASGPKSRRAFQVFPSLGCFVPDMDCFCLVSTHGIGCGSRRIDAGIAPLLHLDQF
jgi:hypothetical protein